MSAAQSPRLCCCWRNGGLHYLPKTSAILGGGGRGRGALRIPSSQGSPSLEMSENCDQKSLLVSDHDFHLGYPHCPSQRQVLASVCKKVPHFPQQQCDPREAHYLILEPQKDTPAP